MIQPLIVKKKILSRFVDKPRYIEYSTYIEYSSYAKCLNYISGNKQMENLDLKHKYF